MKTICVLNGKVVMSQNGDALTAMQSNAAQYPSAVVSVVTDAEYAALVAAITPAEIKVSDLAAIEAPVRFTQRSLREWFLRSAELQAPEVAALLDPTVLLDQAVVPFVAYPYMLKAAILQERAIRARKALP